MRPKRIAGTLFPVLLAASLAAPPLGADPSIPDFDQGVDASAALETVRRSIREGRAYSPPVGPAGELALPGFQTGNEFTATIIRGRISVSCSEGGRHDSASFRCSDEVLDPAEFVRFTGPKGVDADKVTLAATWASGKTREKTKGYDPAAGRSTGRFNLWISTLFQRPLLDYGRNAIRYILKKGGKPVLEGGFVANVRRGETRQCRYRRHYFSSDLGDCRSATTRMCERYFREENYCQ